MHNNPFVFGKAVEAEYFTDRREESARLEQNLVHGINTVIISPRRWGKTSLVKHVIERSEREDVKYVFVDIFSCKSEYEFYHLLSNEIIKQTSSRLEEWVEMAKTFLSNISPKFSFGSDPMHDFSLSFEWSPTDGTETEILNLPMAIAKSKGVRVVVCIDEFQQIAEFGDSLTLQKKLRSVWQHQSDVTYCLFGSKKHLMTSMFVDSSCPLYKFADIMLLDRISADDWVEYITDKFSSTGKSIMPAQARRICEVSECLSSYVQHLAWITWYKATDAVTDDMVEQAINDLLQQNRLFYQRDVEALTEQQLNLLLAIAHGVTSGLSRRDTLQRFHLVSTANVAAARKSLMAKELIDAIDNHLLITDPIFKLWLQRNMKRGEI